MSLQWGIVAGFALSIMIFGIITLCSKRLTVIVETSYKIPRIIVKILESIALLPLTFCLFLFGLMAYGGVLFTIIWGVVQPIVYLAGLALILLTVSIIGFSTCLWATIQIIKDLRK